ncbi:alpha-ketoacid dehydrogenase subunit beta [Rhodospirillaceae bacterium]|jgi:acetoin:2,6-dichlorophenolindophenol oxidoreductase subunit beta|nr:alpha-ketoacid dehydrogenase subunit beta [Rhodospirillaceae bacterium]MBT6304770.1 alpha-ketoacid dehydrogenase subunit beta [Rhodospirillaceae bacterium]MBT7730631.1 alpha-ketoacid dehydrogenase subunit beta [Rhodospirillaceae bacterium]MDC0997838.1 alpha-ketoacid dehydrogenase subunit beta [Alphaproteobacteria bacterium]MDC1441832.1 alpha-ketoacid dehydrogenase subunit beta [Rhodospirillaceae bacterium]
MTVMTYADAAKAALAEEMRRDPLVWAVGEDLGRGGVFGQYKGLAEEFGPERISDAPISEAAIMGASVGAAMAGTRPVVEMRFADFALCAVDELVNQAAKARYMLGGQTKVPMVIREPMGMWRSSAAQHSQSLESWYTHIPGLVVVVPSTPADNKGLLKSAIRSDDPVVYFEHKNIWGLEGEVPDEEILIPFGKARLEREGADITIVSWSAQMHVVSEAATVLQERGISAEIIDLRTLWPWDRETVFSSVEKTGRLLITHESVSVSGFGAEVAATVSEHMFQALKHPVRRCGAPRVPISYAPPLEDLIRVNEAQIIKVVTSMMTSEIQ